MWLLPSKSESLGKEASLGADARQLSRLLCRSAIGISVKVSPSSSLSIRKWCKPSSSGDPPRNKSRMNLSWCLSPQVSVISVNRAVPVCWICRWAKSVSYASTFRNFATTATSQSLKALVQARRVISLCSAIQILTSLLSEVHVWWDGIVRCLPDSRWPAAGKSPPEFGLAVAVHFAAHPDISVRCPLVYYHPKAGLPHSLQRQYPCVWITFDIAELECDWNPSVSL